MSSVLQSPKDTPLEFFQDPDRPPSARMSDRPGGAFSGLRPSSFTTSRGTPSIRIPSITEERGETTIKGNPLLAGPKYFSGGGGGGGGGAGDFGRSNSSVAGETWHASRTKISGSTSRERSTSSSSSKDNLEEEEGKEEDRGVGHSKGKGSLVAKLFRDGSRHFSTRMSFEGDVSPGAFLEDQFSSVDNSTHTVDTTGSALFSNNRLSDSSIGAHITTAAQQRRTQTTSTSRATYASGFNRRRRWASHRCIWRVECMTLHCCYNVPV